MKLISPGLTRRVSKAILKTKKNSPHIFFVAGVAGLVGSTVLACRSTLKAGKEFDEFRGELQGVKEMAASKVNSEYYGEAEYVKDLVFLYGKGTVRFTRLYGVSIVIGGVSIALLTGSHVQLTRRNAALTATITALMKTFDEYRARVREEIGEEKERELHAGIRTEAIEGSKKKAKVIDTFCDADWIRIFDPSNPHYDNYPEYNRIFLETQCRYWNQKLNARGFVFLNEVFVSLDFPQTEAGQILGWVRKGNRGDGYIDFGLYDAHAQEFFVGRTPELVLDFNVDGPILGLIEEIET
jgi:hypothetical protein